MPYAKDTVRPPCSLDGCDRPQKARGYCNRHYLRDARHGSPVSGGSVRHDSDESRRQELWRLIDKSSGCWIFTGSIRRDGYGTIRYDGRSRPVHRVVYELLVAPIPDGLQLDHLCHTNDESCDGGVECPHRACVNPDHLEPVTHRENIRRGVKSRRTTCPQGHRYDVTIERRGGVERRCSTCTNAASRRNKRARLTGAA